jgi:signal-transduction protein with cAMP-binding, CBS, and nucleotidyltransferase domain
MTSRVESHPLISIRSEATVQEAARLMADCSIGALGVLGNATQFVGIITERDLSWFVAQAGDASATRVAEIVNDFPVVVDGPIEDADALARMRSARIRHLIIREDHKLRIVSMRDYLLQRSGDGEKEPTVRSRTSTTRRSI